MITYKGFSTYQRNKHFRVTDFELVKQDLLNYFNIRKGEKLMNPDFGTIIWNILFEPFTNVVKEAVASDVADILNSEPRITVDSLNIVEKDYGLQVLASVTYKTYNISETLQLNFDRDNGLISN